MSTWQIEGNVAALQCGRLTARIDLARPDHGLTAIQFQDRAIDSLSLLGVELPASSSDGTTVHDAYSRGSDLVATYETSPTWPFRTQIYWRAFSRPVE